MGLLGNIIRGLVSETSASQQHQKSVYELQKRYTPEEYVIYEQEQSDKNWYGVPLSELSKLFRPKADQIMELFEEKKI